LMPETHLDFLKLRHFPRHFHRLEVCSTQVILPRSQVLPSNAIFRFYLENDIYE
jgi:hypothetical protein